MEPENSSIPTPPQPKKNNLAVILLSILLVITLLISGYLFLQVQKLTKQLAQLQVQPTPTPFPETPPAELTADWKTYINTDFNFNFKYPSGWTMQEKQPTIENTMIILLSNSAIGTLQVQEGSLADSEAPNLRFEYKNSILDGKTVKLQNIYINNQLYQKAYEIKGNNKTIVISLNPKTQENFEILNQILSTFRFLK